MTLTITNARQQSYTTQSRYVFEGSFFGEVACQQVRDYFGPAVQRLVRDVILNPRFKEIVSSSRGN